MVVVLLLELSLSQRPGYIKALSRVVEKNLFSVLLIIIMCHSRQIKKMIIHRKENKFFSTLACQCSPLLLFLSSSLFSSSAVSEICNALICWDFDKNHHQKTLKTKKMRKERV
mmetsp:Transcript_24341/g.28197  ORF Transcript_24341/g.28197 Transcript_24341/m.28197 type:complete len:113 (+) Transcript_24341:88-426(+)